MTLDAAADGPVRRAKSPDAFRTISEVAEELDVPQHVLRFWETKFTQIRPLKRGGGRRYYRPQDVETLRRIRVLLYAEGYTIRGVQKLLRESARAPLEAERPEEPAAPPPLVLDADPRRAALERAIAELATLREDLWALAR